MNNQVEAPPFRNQTPPFGVELFPCIIFVLRVEEDESRDSSSLCLCARDLK